MMIEDLTNTLSVQNGLPWMKQNEQAIKHPVQQIQDSRLFGEEEAKMKTYARLYGSTLPMILTIERNILAQPTRLPGEKQSLFGLQIMMNKFNEMEFEDFLGTEKPIVKQLSAHERFLKSFD